MKFIYFLVLLMCSGFYDKGQWKDFQLNDLSGFKPSSANWQIVGNIAADTLKDKVLIASPGHGILVNMQDENNRQHIFTNFDHADIELEVEVMMAKESNSGIYFQGRYEVQLYDSYNKPESKYSYMGGIYQRADPVTNAGFEGSAPSINVSKAPGQWQQLKIIFKAPKFDKNGIKIKNAKFKKIYLNGVLIQKNVEVSGPTRSSAFDDEKPTGPIMLQGNHGPVAFRNIRYKK